MSDDILKSLNKINTSVHANDQTLWEAQASTKSIRDATDNIKAECDRLKHDIANIDEEISSVKPQIKILESNYNVQIENILVNQQSLINQRIHKKCLAKKIIEYEQEADKLTNEFAQYIQSCKDNFELFNPTFKVLQTKRTEFKQIKIHCMDLQQKIKELREINKQKIEIKQQLYYKDVVQFAKNWLEKKKYLEATAQLEEEAGKERECIKQLTEITKKIKEKQVRKILGNTNYGFSIPQLQFSQNNLNAAEKPAAKASVNNPFADTGSMLKKGAAGITSGSKSKVDQKPAFNRSHSKVRVLENKILNEPQRVDKPTRLKTKEERTKEVEAKIKKVVENFNKNITRQSSKKSISLSQTSSKSCQNGDKPKPVQQPKETPRSDNKEITPQKDPYEGSGATQAIQKLSLDGLGTKRAESNVLSQEKNSQFPKQQLGAIQKLGPVGLETKRTESNVFGQGNNSQFPKQQFSYFNTERNNSKAFPTQGHPNKHFSGSTFPRNDKFVFQAMPNKPKGPLGTINNSSQFLDIGFNPVFGSGTHTDQANFLDSTGNNENIDQYPVFSPSNDEVSTEEIQPNKGIESFSFGGFTTSQFKFN